MPGGPVRCRTFAARLPHNAGCNQRARALSASAQKRARIERQLSSQRIKCNLTALPGARDSAFEDRCRLAAAPHDRLVRDDHSRTRLDSVVNLSGKLRVDAQARCDLLGVTATATARYPHPAKSSATWNKRALFVPLCLRAAKRHGCRAIRGHRPLPARARWDCHCDRRKSLCRLRSRPS